jgi:dTDP-4-dehydrorhamnose reductase
VRILILGGDGMIGHQLFKQLRRRHEAKVTLRRALGDYEATGLFSPDNAYAGLDLRSLDGLRAVLVSFRPEAVVNAVGVIKQRAAAQEAIPTIEINALLPHRLAVLCREAGCRLLQLSTDCVFSGRKGRYLETAPSDAEDLYGRTKFLGEVGGKGEEHCLTLRTSSIGPELSCKTGLFEWFLAQSGTIKGFTKAVYSGLTTIEMGRVVERVLTTRLSAGGLYHVSSEPIDKFSLLVLLRGKLGKSIEIVPDESFACDRSLDSTRFRREFGYTPPTWDAMAEELCGGLR